MKCEDCTKYLKGEKLDYSQGGCKHTPMEGFICLAFAYEGVASWMVGCEETGCECFYPKGEDDD